MAEEKVTLIVEATGTDSTVDNLGNVKDAAVEIKEGFEKIDEAVEAIRASGDAFDVQRDALLGMRDALTEGVAEAKKLGEAGKEAGELASESIKKIDSALNEIPHSASAATSGIASLDAALDRADKAVAELNARFASGAPVTQKHINTVLFAQQALEREMVKSRATAGTLPPAFARSYDAIGRSVDKAKVDFIELEQAMQRQKRTLNEATGQFRGFGTEITEFVGPAAAKFGLFATAIRAIIPAFKAAVAGGREWLGVNKEMSEEFDNLFIKKFSEAGQRVGAYFSALSAELVAMGSLVSALWSRNGADIKSAAANLKTVYIESMKTMKDIGTATSEEWAKLHPKIEGATAATEKNKVATIALTEAQKEAISAARERVNEEEKLSTALDRVFDSQKKVIEALNEAASDQANAQDDIRQYGEVVQAAAAGVRHLDTAHREASDAVKVLTEQWGEGNPAITTAIEKERLLNTQLQQQRTRLEEAKTAQDNAKQSYDSATTSVASQAKKLGELDTEAGKVKAKQDELATQAGSKEYFAEKAKESTGALKTVFEALAKSAPDVVKGLTDAKEPAAQLAAAAAEAVTPLQKIADADFTKTEAAIDRLIAKVRELKGELDSAEVSMTALSNAGLDEGETGEGLGESLS